MIFKKNRILVCLFIFVVCVCAMASCQKIIVDDNPINTDSETTEAGKTENNDDDTIETTEMVSLLCGLILQSIDPDAIIENNLDNIPPLTKKTLKSWRK